MVGIRPATPGTVLVLAATILLVLVSVSVPVLKSIYFLQANIDVSAVRVNAQASGSITLGVWGYCVSGIGSGQTCSNVSLGYELNADSLFGVPTDISKFISLPNSLIKGLTYALVVHPIAAGFAGLSLIFGLFAHLRELSTTIISTWLASIGAFFAFLAFLFDIILFSIAKSRINSASSSNSNVTTTNVASLGNAIWITLAAWVLLLFSGCAFGCGRRLVRSRPPRSEVDRMKPAPDESFTSQARRDAEFAQRMREEEAARRKAGGRSEGGGGGLPKFAEMEAVPLRDFGEDRDDKDYRDEESALGSGSGGHSRLGGGGGYIPGVGYGHGRLGPSDSQLGVDALAATGYAASPARRQQSFNTVGSQQYPASQAEPFRGMYNTSNNNDNDQSQVSSAIDHQSALSAARNQQTSSPSDGYGYGDQQYPPQPRQQRSQQSLNVLGNAAVGAAVGGALPYALAPKNNESVYSSASSGQYYTPSSITPVPVYNQNASGSTYPPPPEQQQEHLDTYDRNQFGHPVDEFSGGTFGRRGMSGYDSDASCVGAGGGHYAGPSGSAQAAIPGFGSNEYPNNSPPLPTKLPLNAPAASLYNAESIHDPAPAYDPHPLPHPSGPGPAAGGMDLDRDRGVQSQSPAQSFLTNPYSEGDHNGGEAADSFDPLSSGGGQTRQYSDRDQVRVPMYGGGLPPARQDTLDGLVHQSQPQTMDQWQQQQGSMMTPTTRRQSTLRGPRAMSGSPQ